MITAKRLAPYTQALVNGSPDYGHCTLQSYDGATYRVNGLEYRGIAERVCHSSQELQFFLYRAMERVFFGRC
jgi:hypothetical protein